MYTNVESEDLLRRGVVRTVFFLSPIVFVVWLAALFSPYMFDKPPMLAIFCCLIAFAGGILGLVYIGGTLVDAANAVKKGRDPRGADEFGERMWGEVFAMMAGKPKN
jgi:hypothetical protein